MYNPRRVQIRYATLLVSVPRCHNETAVLSNILLSFVLQIPLSLFSKFMEKRYGPRWGNMVVWASLILGQPLCIMMYYHDYVIMQVGEDSLDRYGRV